MEAAPAKVYLQRWLIPCCFVAGACAGLGAAKPDEVPVRHNEDKVDASLAKQLHLFGRQLSTQPC